jgi:hypothetical protein
MEHVAGIDVDRAVAALLILYLPDQLKFEPQKLERTSFHLSLDDSNEITSLGRSSTTTDTEENSSSKRSSSELYTGTYASQSMGVRRTDPDLPISRVDVAIGHKESNVESPNLYPSRQLSNPVRDLTAITTPFYMVHTPSPNMLQDPEEWQMNYLKFTKPWRDNLMKLTTALEPGMSNLANATTEDEFLRELEDFRREVELELRRRKREIETTKWELEKRKREPGTWEIIQRGQRDLFVRRSKPVRTGTNAWTGYPGWSR